MIRYQSKSEDTVIEHIEPSIFGVNDLARLFLLRLIFGPIIGGRSVSSVSFSSRFCLFSNLDLLWSPPFPQNVLLSSKVSSSSNLSFLPCQVRIDILAGLVLSILLLLAFVIYLLLGLHLGGCT